MSDKHHTKKVSVDRVAWTTFGIDTFDFLVLGMTSMVTGSALMLAQVLQGVSNIVTDLFLIIGVRRSRRPRDARHPLGYGRSLYVWTMFSAIMMFGVTTTLSLVIGWQRLVVPEMIQYAGLALAVLAISLITNAYGVRLALKRFRSEGVRQGYSWWKYYRESPYVATKIAFVTDLAGALSSLIGILGMFIYLRTGQGYVDAIGAMVVGLLVGGLAFLLMLNIKDLLVGRGISDFERQKIKQAVIGVPQVSSVKRITTEIIGLNRTLVEVDIHIEADLHTHEIERLTEEVKHVIKHVSPTAFEVVVEVVG